MQYLLSYWFLAFFLTWEAKGGKIAASYLINFHGIYTSCYKNDTMSHFWTSSSNVL